MCGIYGVGSKQSWLTSDSFYQEFLGKTLTEKYTTLNTQMDKVIHNANSEISTLQARLSGWSLSILVTNVEISLLI